VRRFARQPEPPWWGEYERRWLYETQGRTVDPLAWKRDRRTLAEHFHDGVRASEEPARCAYCDGQLGVESRRTVDHFIPEQRCRALAMTWINLYPACDQCNSGFKTTKGSCALLRPDVDPVEAWLDFHPETGRLEPAPVLERRTRARARLTIRVLGLNEIRRCKARQRLLRDLDIYWNTGAWDDLRDALARGVYRFVTASFFASRPRNRLGPLV
jgi:uncharacterized protein (TIGR02646 family)